MQKRTHLILPLLAVAIHCAIARADGPGEEDLNVPTDVMDAFIARIRPRERQIQEVLKAGRREPWEGDFYDGHIFRGLSRGWIISRKAGYVSTSRVLDMGRVEVHEGRVVLFSESPARPWGLRPLEYVVVPWGERVYLVEENWLLAFCNDVNAGALDGRPYGLYLQRVDTYDKPGAGLPRVPEKYREHLLKMPLIGKITARLGAKWDVAVLGEKKLKTGLAVTLDVGKRHGVRTGMRFYPQREEDYKLLDEIFVISVTASQSELLICTQSGDKRFREGMRLTTRSPFYPKK